MHRQTHSPVHENYVSIHEGKSPVEHLGDPLFTLDDTPLTLGDLTPDNDEVPDINFDLSSIEASLSDQSDEECNHRSKRARLYSPQLQAPENCYEEDNEEEELLLSASHHLPGDRTRESAVPVQNESELSLQSAHLDNYLLETFVSVDDSLQNSSGMVQLRDAFPFHPSSDDESEDGALYNVSFSGSELERSGEIVDAEQIVAVSNMDNIISVTNPLHNTLLDTRPTQQDSEQGSITDSSLLDDSWGSVSLYVSSHDDNSILSRSSASTLPSTNTDQTVPSSSDDDLLQSIELQGRRRTLRSCDEQVVPQIDHIEE